MNEEQEALAERAFWRRVGKLIGARLYGWSYYDSASFVDPQCDIPGIAARVMLEQADTIERLTTVLQAARAALNTCQSGMTQLVKGGVRAPATRASSDQFAAAWRDLRAVVDAAEKGGES